MANDESGEREALEAELCRLETELEEAVRGGGDESSLEGIREQIFRTRGAFNRGCN